MPGSVPNSAIAFCWMERLPCHNTAAYTSTVATAALGSMTWVSNAGLASANVAAVPAIHTATRRCHVPNATPQPIISGGRRVSAGDD